MSTERLEPKPELNPRLPGALSLGIAVMAGIVIGWLCSTGCASSKTNPNYALMQQAWNTIEAHYVDRPAIQPQRATYGAIEGMVDSLGDTGHSAFLSPGMVRALRQTEHGEFKGIGVEIGMKNGRVVVEAPLDGSPAQRAGLRAGDIILRVFGKDVSGWSLTEVASKITGPAGTQVTLTILNPRTGNTRELTITRATIKLQDVTWQHLPGTDIAHLRIASFDGGVTKNVVAALRQIERDKLRGVILDLRDNPGGVLDEAVGVASQFLSGGNVLLEKNAKGRIRPVRVEKGGIATNLPMAVLVNQGTASAAEIVAGALRDRHRAVLVGTTTFGTGTVLGEFRLGNGAALLLAVQEWLTPGGFSFWHTGLTPQYVVPLPDDVPPSFPDAEKGMTAGQLRAGRDTQLLRALKLLDAQINKTAAQNSEPTRGGR